MQWWKSVLCWSVAMVGLPLLPVSEAFAARVALVIGNDAYQNTSALKNARADARAMAEKLREFGFSVVLKEDLRQKEMQQTLRQLKNQVQGGDEVVFFYSGHGVEIKGTNYLLPVDIRGDDAEQVADDALPLQRVLSDLEEKKARLSVAIIDACRNNPFSGDGKKSFGGRGLQPMSPAEGQLIIYAANTGQQALDRLSPNDSNPNGVFTRVFLNEMSRPGLQITEVLRNVRSEVKRLAATVGHTQTPALYDAAIGNFSFNTNSRPIDTIPPSLDPETEAWNAAKDSNSAAAVAAYLQEYPRGRYASAAKVLLAKLKEPVSPITPPAVASSTYRAGQELKDCDVCPALVVVPPGSFTMGSPANEEGRDDDESPQHQVNINYSLAVGKYEVTFAEWDACVRAGGCSHRPDDEGWGRGNRPVINVNWDDAQQYVRWLKQKTGKAYRLLSEAEWEYVARAGTSSRYSFGNNEAALGNFAWYDGNSGSKTHPVGQKRPNAFGLYDLEGNVWEWVQDCYQDSYNGAPADGSASQSNNCARRVLRGGSWVINPRDLRSAGRFNVTPDIRVNDVGFRVSRTLP